MAHDFYRALKKMGTLKSHKLNEWYVRDEYNSSNSSGRIWIVILTSLLPASPPVWGIYQWSIQKTYYKFLLLCKAQVYDWVTLK